MFLKKKIFLTFIIIIISIATFSYLKIKFNNKKNQTTQIGGNFELTNHLGENVTNKNFKNSYRLVFFGFTNCPDFCPNTLIRIGSVMEQIDSKKNLVPIFITVDPERDTVNILNKYLKNFHPKIIGLTGTNQQIQSVKEKYKIFSKKVMAMEKDGHSNHNHEDYDVDHTTIIYLMDKKGIYLAHFSPETSDLLIIKKINQYL